MKKLDLLTTLFCSALLWGCSDAKGNSDGDTDATAGSTGSTSGGESSTVTPSTGGSESGDTPTSGTAGPDGTSGTDTGGIGDGQCDPWAQDCPEGFKCMAYAEEGEPAFTGDKCTPVSKNPGTAGDPCTVEGGWWTGVDDCDYGHACWYIDQATNTGTCVALCTGSEDSYSCNEDVDVCVFWVPGIAHVCLQGCDPLLQNCPNAQGCVPDWSSGGQQFTCSPLYTGGQGQEFKPCEFTNACDPGLLCWDPAGAVECDKGAAGCCLAFCDLANPQCAGAGAECASFYTAVGGDPPPAFADVGICVLPG